MRPGYGHQVHLRLATWNLNQRGQRTWDRLLPLGVDVVLVQEARPPAGWAPDGVQAVPPLTEPVSWDTAGGGRPWSTGIVVTNPQLHLRREPTGTRSSRPGTLTLAELYRGDTHLMTLASGYGLFETDPDTGEKQSERTMHNITADLAPLMRSDPSRRLILAGDFNAWTQPYRGQVWPAYQAVFDGLSALGLVDCMALDRPRRLPLAGCPCGGGEICRHVRTYRHRNSPASTPWQNDYVFASRSLEPELVRSEPFGDEGIWQFSDHCPVIAEFSGLPD